MDTKFFLYLIGGFIILIIAIIFLYLIIKISYQFAVIKEDSNSISDFLNRKSHTKSSTLNEHLFMTSTKTASRTSESSGVKIDSIKQFEQKIKPIKLIKQIRLKSIRK